MEISAEVSENAVKMQEFDWQEWNISRKNENIQKLCLFVV